MNAFDPELQSLAWTLIHFIWQGALVWFVVGMALYVTRRARPQIRYALGLGGLVLCLLLPIGTYLNVRPIAFQRASLQATPSRREAKSETQKVERSILAPDGPRLRALENTTRDYLPWVVRIWFLGSLILAIRLGGGWVGLRLLRRKAGLAPVEWQGRLERMSRALGHWRTPRLRILQTLASPLVVGWIRPLILMPAGLFTGLDPTAVEALLAHELAHIHRHDYLVNLVQCVVEILLFYHPAVWWISRRIRIEREHCCDDMAVAWCDDALLYAETLNRLNELRSKTYAPVPALAAGGGDLMFRIKRLLIPNAQKSPRRFQFMAMACSMVLLVGAGLTTRILKAQSLISQIQDGPWLRAGSHPESYHFQKDSSAVWANQPSILLESNQKDAPGFGTVMQQHSAKPYLGKRIRLSAWLKTEAVQQWAGLWLRVDGEQAVLAFDNMQSRSLVGSQDWTQCQVVLDVAPEAKNLAFGLLMAGPGRAWMNDARLEIVDSSVATTDLTGDHLRFDAWKLVGADPGSYAAKKDLQVTHDGKPTYALAFTGAEAKGFGTLAQQIKAGGFVDKRIRLSAWIKAEGVEDWAGMWMRVDGDKRTTAFDNMGNRPIKGTQNWARYDVVLDVAPESKGIALGILLAGKGKVWIAEPTLEIVDASVPSTNLPTHPQ